MQGFIRALDIFLIQDHRRYFHPTNFQSFYFHQALDGQGPRKLDNVTEMHHSMIRRGQLPQKYGAVPKDNTCSSLGAVKFPPSLSGKEKERQTNLFQNTYVSMLCVTQHYARPHGLVGAQEFSVQEWPAGEADCLSSSLWITFIYVALGTLTLCVVLFLPRE